ncbi:MAG: hypothetical protein U0Z75_02330 [Deinococcaceae bacterium]
MKKLLCLSLFALSSAWAWNPSLDANLTETLIDSAFGRGDAIDSVLTIDLSTKDNVTRPGLVTLMRGDPSCITRWTQDIDQNFPATRPIQLTVGGQADLVYLLALDARDRFEVPSAEGLLAEAQKVLPANNLRIYTKMTGLASEKQREAYTVGLNIAGDKPLRPYKTNYLPDWKKGANQLWGGTMVYYFDLTNKAVNAKGTLPFIFQTGVKADQACVYQINIDLSKFF